MPLYSYRCACGLSSEHLRPMSVEAISCACGQMAHRMGANRIAVVAPSVDTRGMFRRYQEASAEIDHAATAVEQRTGEPVQTPNLWKQSKATADAMIAAGENPYSTKQGA